MSLRTSRSRRAGCASVQRLRRHRPPSRRPMPPQPRVAVIAGPSCQAWRPLRSRPVPGRAVRIVRPRHRGSDGRTPPRDPRRDRRAITFTQLTGRVPARLDGELCATDQPIEPGRSLRLGASRIVFRAVGESTGDTGDDDRPAGSIVPSESDPWRRVVRRGPARPETQPPPSIAVPAPPAEHRPPPFTGLVGAAIAAAGAGLMAVVLGQPLFAAFAVLGAMASLATWVVGAVASHRRGRRAAALHRQEIAALSCRPRRRPRRRRPNASRRSPGRRRRPGSRRPPDLGASNRSVHEPLRATIGRGTWRRAAADRRRRPPQAPTGSARRRRPIRATHAMPRFRSPSRPATIVALHGDLDGATALARSIIVQLATWYGPADWRLLIETNRPDDWEWTTWLPHTLHDTSTTRDRPTERSSW